MSISGVPTKGLAKLCFSLLSFSSMVTLVVLAHSAVMSRSLREQAYQYYVQGYQRGKADAMATEEFKPSSRAELSTGFSREYVRGYRDGYKLINR